MILIYGALILGLHLYGQQTVYQFVRLFLFFLSNGNKITNVFFLIYDKFNDSRN